MSQRNSRTLTLTVPWTRGAQWNTVGIGACPPIWTLRCTAHKPQVLDSGFDSQLGPNMELGFRICELWGTLSPSRKHSCSLLRIHHIDT